MILCRVVGNMVSTVKHPSFKGHRILIVQPIDENGNDSGREFLASDNCQACPGDVTLCSREGNTARQLLGTMDDPFHSVIIGVVDKVYTRKNEGE